MGSPLKPVVSGIFLGLLALAPACLNARDTLADEAKKNRDVLTTLVGGFERNPPLYYEMRIARITKDLAKNPKLISEYDDIAVANDRIGNDDEAIKWIELKKKQLAPLNMSDDTSKDEWYKYYANCGTFWVHRWAHNGADSKKIDQVAHGETLIQQALRINPDAHFGREKYQLMVMQWLIETRKPAAEHEPLGGYIQGVAFRGPGDIDDKRSAAITGLAGLIRLGGAWQSADIYWAIGQMFFYPAQSMAGIAKLRAREIIAAGGRSLDPQFVSVKDEEQEINDHPELDNSEIAEYNRLRKLADDWNAKRQAFMMAKLTKGDHPDTDPHFWDGAPVMPKFEVRQTLGSWVGHDVATLSNIFIAIVGIANVTPILIIVLLVGKAIRRRKPA